ncbi:hypothetical protein [Achromobacter insuavis]|uniref:hypothetical protein n=1 Tax=Achromobacter insuavis TaxID=1287735 RepID=UPI0029DD6C28|nr:hypothetical protein [Achromobacter sp.]MCG2601828.1 hypothetical protein [Achromobacter sp.]
MILVAQGGTLPAVNRRAVKMSAVSSILTRLTAEQQEKVDRMINLQPRLTITQMTDALVAEGIPIKRSALGRYVKSVRDPLQKTASATSLAVIIDTRTGSSTTLPLALSPDAVRAVLQRYVHSDI